MTTIYDYIIAGGGIVGLATGMALARRFPSAEILLLEKEDGWGRHQTGHNSGVIHSGIYYTPGSLKATLAREGNRSMVAFCQEHGIAHEVCGKVIVAASEDELPRLEHLHARALANGLEVQRIGPDELREIEPHVRGVAALHLPSTGIVDYRQVCERYAQIIREAGGELRTRTRVSRIAETDQGVEVETDRGSFRGKLLINCAGLHSDRVARAAGQQLDMQIVPFRGEYYALKPDRRHLVRNLIYPVPDPAFPFLGVHFTRMIGGQVEAGPNAVLSLKREGYRKTDFDLRDMAETLRFPGFWRFALKHWRMGAAEVVRSFSKAAFVRSLQRLIPEIQEADLEPAPAGVRAQAMHVAGRLVDDFHIVRGRRSVHVCNAPSPAATASIEIGRTIAGYATNEA